MEAETILQNGVIVSMDDDHHYFKAIAIKNGRIIALGDNSDVQQYTGKDTKVIDLEGKTVVPGLIDAHQHMFSTGFNLQNVDCRVTSIKEMVERVKERAQFCDPEEWIIGWGFDESSLTEKRLPTKDDFVDINNPIFISRYCLHAAVVNDTALKTAGVTKESTVDTGELKKDNNGELTGVLKEEAMDLVTAKMPPYSTEQMKQALRLADKYYVQHGITAVHEAGFGFITGSFKEYTVFNDMVENQSLNVRMNGMILNRFYKNARDMNLKPGSGSHRLKIGPIKMFADGTISGMTASVTKAYRDNNGYGQLVHSYEDLARSVLEVHKAGWQIAIHAIGDHAVKQVLDAYENALEKFPRSDCRHRIEHASIANKNLLQRMSRLGIISVPQPSLIHLAGDVYMENLQDDVINHVFAINSFCKYGLTPAGSSDSPATPCSPMLGIYTAVSRETKNGKCFIPEERVSLYEALKMYTKHAAYASFEETEKGTLEVGKLGDLTILPKGFLNFSPQQIKNTEIDMTIIGGEIIYEKERDFNEKQREKEFN
ncbi:amidohydrolase [Lentibacillus halophilus]|uniref:Amidohydrolase n=1 Tax=Lentibacillus halophilus TaxID=295065 RepID=A0ABN0Z5R1_9BACI